MECHLSFKLVSLLCICFVRDAQYQRTDNIAIQKKHYFRQPPSEPWELIKERPVSLNSIDERPYPLDLIIFNVVDSRTRAQTSYLLVQSDSVIIEQQCLANENMSVEKQVMDWIAIQGTRLVSEQTWDEVDVTRLLEPLTTKIVVRLGDSENCGSFRVEWIIACCWKS
jgi:hypothetical protein